ncbi:RHH-type transcriptional regulator, rel operon repressor / antitoxin RelB [Bartonella sp. WD12.1]|nr:RHH-type transcriptional regulator, rel operon repressor / antitoxin RelB [Bartonella sp. WD12.1]
MRYTCITMNTKGEECTMTISIRLPSELETRLNNLALKTGRTKSFYLREIIEQGIEEAEDYYLASQVRERVRKGNATFYSSEEVRKELGLDD